MSTIKILVVTWAVLVASVVAAKAQDTLTVPADCRVDAAEMANIHLVMCGGDIDCTQRVVTLVCGGAK